MRSGPSDDDGDSDELGRNQKECHVIVSLSDPTVIHIHIAD
jgi:hypothetical protein